MINTLYQYEYLEFSFEQGSSVESKEKENNWPLNDFLNKLKKSEVWSKNIGKIINELNDSQIQPLKSDLIKKWYSNSVDTTYRKESIFIEYIKYTTKIVERNNTSFEKVLEWYTKNSKSGTTKNERRFLQVYLYINGHFDAIVGKKSLIDECDGIIWSKTQEAITRYKNNKNQPEPEMENRNPTIIAENETPASSETITEWSQDISNWEIEYPFNSNDNMQIEGFQNYYNDLINKGTIKWEPLKLDGQRWPKTKQAVKYCWENGVRVWWYKEEPLFANTDNIISLCKEKFGDWEGFKLLEKLGGGDKVTLMKRVLALAKHEGNFAFGKTNWDPSNKWWFSKGTFQIFDENNVEARYNSLFNKTIAKYNLNKNNLTSADKDIIARVGHVNEKWAREENKNKDLWKILSNKNLNASELARFISKTVQVWWSVIGKNVAMRTMPPSKIRGVFWYDNSLWKDGSFIWDYV